MERELKEIQKKIFKNYGIKLTRRELNKYSVSLNLDIRKTVNDIIADRAII